jgi:hypothetical protein
MNILYPNCIPVMGAKNLIFYDLEKQTFQQFCKTDFFYRQELGNMPQFDLAKVHHQGLRLLDEHQFLMPEKDPSISKAIQPSSFYKWMNPSLITNAVIELSSENGLLMKLNFDRLVHYLEKLLCKHILLKISERISFEQVKLLMDAVAHSSIHSLQLVLLFDEHYHTNDFGMFIIENPKIKWLIFELSPFQKNLENKIFFYKGRLRPSEKKSLEQFVTNLFLFSESQLHHTYFNKKLFIGNKGEIKNAPECTDVYGNILEIDQYQQLLDVITTPAFQKFWYVTKERSEGCKDCEFRFMCIDNRVPHLKKNGYWAHVRECNYDPYSGKWSEGSTV